MANLLRGVIIVERETGEIHEHRPATLDLDTGDVSVAISRDTYDLIFDEVYFEAGQHRFSLEEGERSDFQLSEYDLDQLLVRRQTSHPSPRP
jgi:hypothetical protein